MKIIGFTDYVSGIWVPDCSKLAVNWKNGNDVTIIGNDVMVKTLLKLFWFSHQIWLLVQVSCQYRHWLWSCGNFLLYFLFLTRNPEIGKPRSEFCGISGDWGQLGMPNLARTSLIKCYWILKNISVSAFLPFVSY